MMSMFARQQRHRQPPSPIFTEIDDELDEELEIVNHSTELGFESNVDIVTVSDCDSGTDLEEKDMEIDDDESGSENDDNENEVPPLTKYGKIDTAKLDQELENELKELK